MKSSAMTSAKRVKLVLMRSALFFLLWWALTEGEGGGWFALPVVLLATSASLALSPAGSLHWRATGLFGFVFFFLRESLRGGIDVAWRALHPHLPIAPVMFDYRLRLPAGSARMLMASTVSLLPGTLSADLKGALLRVHALDGRLPIADALKALERCLAGLYSMKLEEP